MCRRTGRCADMNSLNLLICWSLANVPTLTRPLTNVLSQFRHEKEQIKLLVQSDFFCKVRNEKKTRIYPYTSKR